jgi:hypothetical protein
MLLPWLLGLRLWGSLRARRALALLAVRLLDRLGILRLSVLVLGLASALLGPLFRPFPTLGCTVFVFR